MGAEPASGGTSPDLTNHFCSSGSRNVKVARHKHGSSLARYPNPDAGPSSSVAIHTKLLTPLSSQSQAEMDARRMLISPPPEEFLQRNRTVVGRHTSLNILTQQPSTSATTSQKSAEPLAKRKRQTNVIAVHDPHPSNHDTASGEDGGVPVDGHAIPEATPNSKPRKQSKRHVDFVPRESSPMRPSASHAFSSVTTPTRHSRNRSQSPTKRTLVLSPHHTNPSANYIPPSPHHRREHISTRRRSATPIFPYEPPPDRFTPPREVLCSPSQDSPTRSRAGRRKSVQSAKGGRRLTLTIKKEPPVIDFSQPVPPPSPTDDPLLLSGPPRRRKSKASLSKSRLATPARRSVPHFSILDGTRDSPYAECALNGSSRSHSRDTPPLAPSSPAGDEDAPLPELLMDAPTSDFSFDDDDGEPGPDTLPVFKSDALDAASDWSDEGRGEDEWANGLEKGEYTGRFRVVAVPTKADPPSSCTRMRMDAWGRPKSPHPRLVALREGSEAPEEDEMMNEGDKEVFHAAGVEEADNRTGVDLEQMALANNGEVERGAHLESALEVAGGETGGIEAEEAIVAVDEKLDEAAIERELSSEDPESVHLCDEVGSCAEEVPWRTLSSSSVRMVEATSAAQDDVDFDVPMDDTSDQDTLTELDLDRADEVIAHLSSKEKESPIASSDNPPLASTSATATEPPVEVTEFFIRIGEDEDSDAEDVATSELSFEAEELRRSLDEGEEEDRSEEAIIDRELSVMPDDNSEDEEEGPVEVAEHIVSSIFNSSGFEPSIAPVHDTQPEVEYDYDDSDGEESESLDDGIIKITSDDPLAAARAAAILRLHDYDCVPRVLAKKRRHSHFDVASVVRDARRRSSLAAGVSKAAASTPKRRHTLGGMLGDKVFLPGSPALTIPELLNEAERSLDLGLGNKSATSFYEPPTSRDAFVTPSKPAESFNWATPDLSASVLSVDGKEGPSGAWTRKDWKRLDSCLTDERLALGEGRGLMGVESVDLERVVDRYFAQLYETTTEAAHVELSRSREDVLRRARALQKKQQTGKIAPPTPSTVLSNPRAVSSREGTKDGSEQHPPSHSLPTPSETERPRTRGEGDLGAHRPTLATRVKGFFYSYLPVAVGTKPQPAKKRQPMQPGLPVPPPETFAKPRAPVHTPASKPIPKPVPPKNTVQLNPVPPPKPSRIPRGKEQPRRLVDLRTLPPPSSEKSLRLEPLESRRSSSGSVRDLIQAFEGLREGEGSRPSSVVSQRGASKLNERPIWRP